ncbi:Hsp20 family protein [Methylophilus glucosoxydans]|uniref:Hsp20 family protein n=1 Tax=Methylophilus glucosoxydans TaxID=752553 RepID=A0ABW3GDS9_9PROT|nr:Hsp20 family protein [Methylophilus sp. 13]MBF5040593.1 Hsp20 family protein [Methylophilus sp. 13]
MRSYDLTPFYRTAIGFDRLAKMLNESQRSENEISYPPYNIELVDENAYKIVMAVAGFQQDELEIETEHQALRVTGRKAKKEQETTYLHRGIATRDFEHKFQLADHVKVTGAQLENGLLTIALVREIPEALKPRKIEIGTAVPNASATLIEQKAA